MPLTQILLWNVVWCTFRVTMEPVPPSSHGPTLWLSSSTQDSLTSSGLKTRPAQKLRWLPQSPDYKVNNTWRIFPPTILRHEQQTRSWGKRNEALLQQANLNSCLRVDQIHLGMEYGALDKCNLSNKNNSIFND